MSPIGLIFLMVLAFKKDLSSAKALREEIERQKQVLLNGEQDARMNIALLYSLAASPIYNVYSAKKVLNKHRNNGYSKS